MATYIIPYLSLPLGRDLNLFSVFRANGQISFPIWLRFQAENVLCTPHLHLKMTSNLTITNITITRSPVEFINPIRNVLLTTYIQLKLKLRRNCLMSS